jgi:lipoate-protein ligase B
VQSDRDELTVEWRGRERYAETWDYQLRLHAERRQGAIDDTLILVEHEPVITLGRQGDPANLLLNEQALADRGVDFHRVERGGDITFHGPGQLVGYLIIDLRARQLSVHDLMRGLEEALILTVAEYGISAARQEGLTGVWLGELKLAALGVAVRGGVSYHGFALNVCTDLDFFSLIVPCGLTGKQVTSVAQVSGRAVVVEDVRLTAARLLAATFGYTGIIEA